MSGLNGVTIAMDYNRHDVIYDLSDSDERCYLVSRLTPCF